MSKSFLPTLVVFRQVSAFDSGEAMPHWSVDEQTVQMDGGTLQFAVDADDFAVVHLLLLKEDGSGSKLTFARNGIYQGASKVEKQKDEPAPAATEAGAKGGDEEDEPHKKRGGHR